MNNLEAMAQWVHFSQARVPFHLYVPVQGYEAARRLAEALPRQGRGIWTYRPAVGFDLVRMHFDPRAHARGDSRPGARRTGRQAAARAGAGHRSKEPANRFPPPRRKGKPSPKPAAKAAVKAGKARAPGQAAPKPRRCRRRPPSRRSRPRSAKSAEAGRRSPPPSRRQAGRPARSKKPAARGRRPRAASAGRRVSCPSFAMPGTNGVTRRRMSCTATGPARGRSARVSSTSFGRRPI